MRFSLYDHKFMARAMQLAKQGRYTTTPNPNVGCVIVKSGQIISEGWHQKAGTGHAEVNALASLSNEQSAYTTAYVTLEPCSHYGRTPPCALRLIEAGVSRVVIAMLDPNPQVAGKGVKMLEQAGIQVDVGLLEQDARALNLGFLSRMERQRPFVQVKLAASLDGKTALKNGESKWITGSEARADVQLHRALACAVLSTAQTVLADDAKLNVRKSELAFPYPDTQHISQIRQPVKVILDGRGQLTASHVESLGLFQSQDKVVLVRQTSTEEFEKFPFIQVHLAPYKTGTGFDLASLLNWCYRQELGMIWVEAGARLAASFVEQREFDELIVYQAPKILGCEGREMLPIGPLSAMSDTLELSIKDIRKVGNDMKTTYGKIDNQRKI